MSLHVPFNKPYSASKSVEYVSKALASTHHSGDGEFTKRCHLKLEEILGVHKTLLTPSCTHALEMSAILLDLQPGDEVIMPSFTFVSTANAFVLRGAIPVFVDIRSDTLNIDESLIECAITPKTKAIVVVHYAGISCEMDAILGIATHYSVPVIEDNAHGIFGRYKGRPLGSFGLFSTQSFHETKNISCGEGGALSINDQSFVLRSEIIREKGTNRTGFKRGEFDKYGWVDIGSSWLPSDITAAILLSQLDESELIQNSREQVWRRYHKDLQQWASSNNVQLPFVPDGCEPSWHLYYLLFPSQKKRDSFIMHLREHGIVSVFHYLPLHTSSYVINTLKQHAVLPKTESLYCNLARLPLFNYMSDQEQSYVVDKVCDFKCC